MNTDKPEKEGQKHYRRGHKGNTKKTETQTVLTTDLH